MIVIINTWDMYVIAHFPRRRMARYMCSFRKDFLSHRQLPYTRLLPGSSSSVFLLNDRQDTDVHVILQKINEEKGSGYMFSDDLQRTYIIELIHYIIKLHSKALPSAN